MADELHIIEDGVLTGIVRIPSRTTHYWGTDDKLADILDDLDGGIVALRGSPSSRTW